MRKITSILMLLCVFAGVTSASAQVWRPTRRAATLEAGKQYMLYNTAKDNENRSGFFFNNGSGLGFSGVQQNPSTFFTSDNRYFWTLEATGNECEYYMKSVPTGTYVGPAGVTNNTDAKNLYIQPWMTSQAPKGNANSVNTDGTVTANADITAENCVFTICGTGLTSNGESAGKGDCWNGTSNGWTKWRTSHPYAFYEVEQVRTAEEITAYTAAKERISNSAFTIQSNYGLVTSADKYTTNAQESSEGPIAGLLDGNYNSHFHSRYQGDNVEENHYLQVELPEATSSFRFYFKKRNGNNNNRPTNIKIQGSLDGTTFADVTTISSGLPTDASVLDYFSEKITSETAYKYYRFVVMSTNTGESFNNYPFFTFSEFYVLPGDNTLVNEVFDAARNIYSLTLDAENYNAVVSECNTACTKLDDAMKTVTINYEYNSQVFYTTTAQVLQGKTVTYTSDVTRYGLTCNEATKSITVGADNNVVTFTYSRNSDVIPFETTDGITNVFPEGTKWYYMTVRNRYCRYDAESGKVMLPDSRGELLYKDLFAFSGDPANGYKIYNYVAGATKVIGDNNVATNALVSLMEDNVTQRYLFECNEGHYVFRKVGTSLGYLNDIHSETALGYWVHDNAKTDGGSTFVFEAVDADEIAQIPLNEAKESYQDVYDRIYAMVIGTGAGKYTSTADADTYAAAREAAIEAWKGTDADAITKALEAAATILEKNTFTLNMPTAGFYRIKSMNANFENMRGKYVQNTGTEGHEVTASNGVNSVFYISDDNKILSFASGQYLNDYQTQAAVGDEGKAWTIEENTSVVASYALKADGQGNWMSDWTNANKTTYGQKDGSAAWAIEPVEWLPIPMNTEIGYATLYSPVALGRFYNSEERVKVYTAKVNDAKTAVEMTECTEGVPANIGVILEYKAGVHTDGCVYLPLATTEITGKTSDMIGTFAATLVQEDGYVLSKPANKTIGLYKAEKNQQKDAVDDSWKNNGFKAYLPASLVPNNAPVLTFDFGTETGIENIVNAAQNNGAIYDLSGRRVKNAQKGIFIINGKKVVK